MTLGLHSITQSYQKTLSSLSLWHQAISIIWILILIVIINYYHLCHIFYLQSDIKLLYFSSEFVSELSIHLKKSNNNFGDLDITWQFNILTFLAICVMFSFLVCGVYFFYVQGQLSIAKYLRMTVFPINLQINHWY